MVDTQKEQERDELHRAIWAIADELRGAVDGWDFKNYVLGTMFYRYISENLCNYINSGEIDAGNNDFDFAKMPDEDAEEAREGLVEEKGFFILPSELFCNVRANAANDENLNETLERVFRHIEESAKGSEAESGFAGLFIDATSECVKVTNNNKLTPENIDRIVDVFAKREEVEHFAHLASYEEVSGNDYNLSVSTYVEAEDTREKIDIVKLNAEIKEIVAREQVLRDEIDKIIAEIEVNE